MPPRELTDTRTRRLQISVLDRSRKSLKIPSTHFDGVIYAKLYRGAAVSDSDKAPGASCSFTERDICRTCICAIPITFREQMFNNLLVQHGYVVLDMDYRASAGYGRDWRTAIYRQMGHPELEDLLDGKKWLAEHAAVDPKRVGVYGGSYGGFMTLMALFRAPGEFAAGAALRPVTDWMQYENDYTSAILNDPQIDPIAYARSSPIEFAGRFARSAAHLPRRHRRQRTVRGFDASVRALDRIAQGQLHYFSVPAGPPRLHQRGFLAG